MNFNVYLDDATARRLTALAKRRRTTRNAIIRDAVKDWLEMSGAKRWPAQILSFEGLPDLVPFEKHRADLGAAPVDPFGET